MIGLVVEDFRCGVPGRRWTRLDTPTCSLRAGHGEIHFAKVWVHNLSAFVMRTWRAPVSAVELGGRLAA